MISTPPVLCDLGRLSANQPKQKRMEKTSMTETKYGEVGPRTARRNLLSFILAGLFALPLCISFANAQTALTGAVVGTVTDPSGAIMANAKDDPEQVWRQIKCARRSQDQAGDYKFSFLPPGNYTLDFSATGFNAARVASVTLANVTETETFNQTLVVGAAQAETVTVQANAEVLQTESAALGGTVTGSQINALPMANGNFTEIIGLSAGTAASVDNATALGRGTQDISANGVSTGSNNFQMDGVSVNNISNAGSSNDATIHGGIPIPRTGRRSRSSKSRLPTSMRATVEIPG